jgi:hypothetical protein
MGFWGTYILKENMKEGGYDEGIKGRGIKGISGECVFNR